MSAVIPKASVHVHQGLLENQLRKLFPNAKIHVETKKQSNLKYPTTEAYLELDIWIPEHNISFEFQDTYHYINTWYTQSSIGSINTNDRIKRKIVQQKGITLIVVPCWWDGSLFSLAATIRFQRPDLLSAFPDLIPLNPPSSFFPESEIPDVGELMVASFPADIKFIRSVTENSWWIGEKYDGVRSCWNPNRLKLYTRSARAIALHPKFISMLPRIFVDGELWFGRGSFSLTYNLYKDSEDFVSWDMIRFVAFDVPSSDHRNIPFEKRYTMLLDNTKMIHPFLSIAMRVKCRGSVHLNKTVSGIIDNEGEGVICRMVGSEYVNGRSHKLVKLKTSYGDHEALVLSVGKDSSVLLKLPSGEIFVVPPTGVKIPAPEVGDVVTFSYEIHARRGVSVNPEIERVRKDISWEEVVLNSIKEKKHRNEYLQSEVPQDMHSDLGDVINHHGKAIMNKFEGDDTLGHENRSWKEIRHRRQFFETYAKENGFDPLVPENWYSKAKEWTKSQKVHSVLSYYDNSVTKALIDLFPEIGLDKSKLVFWPLHYSKNRRQFFEDFANRNNFDPLIPDNWYLVSEDSIFSEKEGENVIGYHQNSFPQALLDLFPEIGLTKSKFLIRTGSHFSKGSWATSLARRNFFEKYAITNGFDHLIAKNWYSQSTNSIKAVKGAQRVLSYHGNSVSKALMDLFPNIGLDRTKFDFPQKYWNKPHNRRKFFEDYAKVNAFNPFEPEKWYTVAHLIEYEKGARQILSYHQNSFVKALSDLFPNIDFDGSKFINQSYWVKLENRRKTLESYAVRHAFDPLVPENWYLVNITELTSSKDLQQVLYYYKHNAVNMLLDLFPNIGLDQYKFNSPQRHWHRMVNRRKFFEDYAKENNFNPLEHENWYFQSADDILSKKGAHRVLFYHHDSISRALLELFPDITFDKSKLIFPKIMPEVIRKREKLLALVN